MKRTLVALLMLTACAAIGFGVLALMSPAAQAVGCPPPSGPVSNIPCGGIAGLECPGRLVCIDDPRDDCCPQTGGADCSGVCVRPGRR